MIRAERIHVSGAAPLKLLHGLASPLHGRTWSADVVRLAAPSSVIDLAVLEPHTYRSTTASTARRATLLVGVAAGRLCGTADDRPFEVLPGQALFVDARQLIRSQVDEQVQLVRVLTETSRGPSPDDDPRAAPVLLDTPVLRSCLAAANALVRQAHTARLGANGAAVTSLMTGVHRALLIEAHRQRDGDIEPSARAMWRDQVELYIEAHLDEQDLTPVTIAHALGVSLRTVHNAFEASTTSVGAHIRTRRVEEVARAMLSADLAPAEIAAAFGFRDTAHMSRTFRAVTGRTLGEVKRLRPPIDDAPR